MKVVVIAFGTRGDVQPLLVLAAGLAGDSAPWCSKVVVVTHKDHAGLVYELLHEGARMADITGFVAVDSPPVIWKGLNGSHATETSAGRAQQDACREACEGAGLVVFNMFAMEAYHVAERTKIPCAVCHPYLPATPMPAAFPQRMRRRLPTLYRHLRACNNCGSERTTPNVDGTVKRWNDTIRNARSSSHSGGDRASKADDIASGTPAGSGSNRTESAWSHVEHWMWPLFTDKWAAFREHLGLGPFPLLGMEEAGGRPQLPKRKMKEAAGSVRIDLAQMPPVLYLFSSLIVDTSPFWPRGVQACGYLYPSQVAANALETTLDSGSRIAASPPSDVRADKRRRSRCLPEEVEAFLSYREDKPLYVCFGSMWWMCPPGYRLAAALEVVLKAAQEAGCRCIFSFPDRDKHRDDTDVKDTDPVDPLRELRAARDFLRGQWVASAGPDELLVHRGALAHELLLPRCSLAVHHGGSGTTAAVLRAGIPHVVFPQHLDQFFWAERVSHLSVGRSLDRSLFTESSGAGWSPPAVLVSKATSAILSALTPQMKLRAACLGVKIRAENGLSTALDALYALVRGSERGQEQADSQPRPHGGDALAASVSSSNMRINSGLGSGCRSGGADDSKRVQEVMPGEAHAGAALESAFRGTPAELVMRHMPNGLGVWCGAHACEEVFFIYEEIFVNRCYGSRGIVISDGDIVWDVGANVGLASIFFELQTDSPDSLQIYAFEPLPSTTAALRHNLSAHCPRAVILDYALGADNDDAAVATFYPRMPGNSTFKPDEKERLQGGLMRPITYAPSDPALQHPWTDAHGNGFFSGAQQVACKVRTLSWAVASLDVDRIDLLKIDVEGAELDVLHGVHERDWPKIRQVVAEVHPVADRLARLCALLRRHGFRVTAQARELDGTLLGSLVVLESESSPSPGSGAPGVGVIKERSFDDARRPTEGAQAAQTPSHANEQGRASLGDDRPRRSFWDQEDAALDGVVYMLYATRPGL